MLLFGHLASLLAFDEPTDNKSVNPLVDEANPLPGLPEIPAVVPPTPAPAVGGPMAVGTTVRDMLSGREGTVVQGPAGDFGSVVFVQFEDGKTTPMRGDQLEQSGVAPLTPVPPPPVVPEIPAELPPVEEPKAEEKKAEKVPGSTENMKALEREGQQRLPQVASLRASQTLVAKSLGDAKEMDRADLIKALGAVPANWDAICASAAKKGIDLKASELPSLDGLSAFEKKVVLLASGKTLAEVNALLTELTPRDERPVDEKKAELRKGVDEALKTESDPKTRSRISRFRKNKETELNAGKPTVDMPKEDPGVGMAWAWDSKGNRWYLTTKASAEDGKVWTLYTHFQEGDSRKFKRYEFSTEEEAKAAGDKFMQEHPDAKEKAWREIRWRESGKAVKAAQAETEEKNDKGPLESIKTKKAKNPVQPFKKLDTEFEKSAVEPPKETKPEGVKA